MEERDTNGMTLTDIDKLLEGFGSWFKSHSRVSKIPRKDGNNIFEITIPFLDRLNDFFAIYIQFDKDGKEIRISDQGYISSNLYMCGTTIMTREIEDIIGGFGFGVRYEDPQLVAVTDSASFYVTLVAFIQAMTVLDHLAVTKDYSEYVAENKE